jgi:Fe-S cluster assembly iron-binding protein IscA
MGLVLDEQKENDKIFEEGGLKFVVGDDLTQFEGFDVDYSSSFLKKGFSVDIIGMSGGSC